MYKSKPVLKYDDEHKGKLKSSRCLLTVSVGQEAHEGEKFLTTALLVSEEFKRIVLLVDDSLQRHTMAIDGEGDADSYYKTSIEAGDKWLIRNKSSIRSIKNLEKIIRWDYFLNHMDFKKKQAVILKEHKESEAFKFIMNSTIEGFLNRFHRRLSDKKNFDMERARNLCFNYLVEECAAMCLWPETFCDYEVYPGKRNMVMSEVHKKFILSEGESLLHAVWIKFKNRKQYLPQELVADKVTI